jgi:hypothetical protein
MEEDSYIHPNIIKSLVSDNEKISNKIDNIGDDISEASKEITLLKEKVARIEAWEGEFKKQENKGNNAEDKDSQCLH